MRLEPISNTGYEATTQTMPIEILIDPVEMAALRLLTLKERKDWFLGFDSDCYSMALPGALPVLIRVQNVEFNR